MSYRRGLIVLSIVMSSLFPSLSDASPKDRKFVVSDGNLKTTSTGIYTNSPEMRAVLATGTDHSATLQFTYKGQTAQTSRLGDGEIRNQFGIKMRAKDICNIVYIMWRFSSNEIVVQVKSNPGLSTSKQCADGGYQSVISVPAPTVAVNTSHVLQTSISGTSLIIIADGKTVWAGVLPAVAFTFNGPIGVRSDNVQVLFTLQGDN